MSEHQRRQRRSCRLLESKVEAVRKKLFLLNLSNDTIIERIDISRDTFYNFLKCRNIAFESFKKICDYFQIPWQELAEGWSSESIYLPSSLTRKIFFSSPREYADIIDSFKQVAGHSNYTLFADSEISTEAEIDPYLRERIEECDYLLVCLSGGDLSSPRIPQKIQLALDAQSSRKDIRPVVIGVTVHGVKNSVVEFALNNREAFNFAKQKCIELNQRPTTAEIQNVMQEISLKIDFVTDPDSNKPLFDSSIACYKELFPNENERIKPTDIIEWIKESSGLSSRESSFKRLYTVLHLAQSAVGMSFVECPIGEPWCFGSYFGIKSNWRAEKRAQAFINAIEAELQRQSSELKGIVFETHPVDFQLLQLVAERGKIAGESDQDRVIKNLVALRRLKLFQSFGARVILQEDETPFPYIQPALGDELAEDEEQHLFLLAYEFGKREVSASPYEVIDFLYDKFFKTTRNRQSNVYVPRFDTYIDALRERINTTVVGELKFDRLPISRTTTCRLWEICNQENLSEYLEL